MSETFILDGVNLNNSAYAVRLLANVDGVPPRRGDNAILPGRPGRRHRYAPLDQRAIDVAMWVRGKFSPERRATAGQGMGLLLALTYSGGEILAPAISARQDLQAQQEMLQELFGRDGQMTLQRIMDDGSERSMAVEVANEILFRPQSDDFASFVVELLAAKPFWTASLLTTAAAAGIHDSPYDLAVVNPGTAEHRGAIISIGGQITNPRLTIGSCWVQYTGTVNAGQTLSIDCGAFTASKAGGNVANAISHGGDVDWLMIPPGSSSVILTGSSLSSVSVSISFYARYL